MKGLHFLLGGIAAIVFADSAQACYSGQVRTYFSYDRPNVTGSTVRLLINIPNGEVRDFGTIRARLVSGERVLSDNAYVRIWLGEPAIGTNCVELGPTEGPVFVIGTLRRSRGRELVLIAETRRQTRSRSFLPRNRRDPSFYDQYIIDPAYRSDAPSPTAPPRSEDER